MVEMVTLPDPECRLGYTFEQLEKILGGRLDFFGHWMRGQTMAICDGRQYSHETQEYTETCGGTAHGVIVYRYDLERYLLALPVVD